MNRGLHTLFSILIHAPYGGKEARLGSWRALVEAQKAGKTRSIGVSNYGIHHLEELEEYIQSGGGGEISVGQYELHPWLDHSDIAEWCQSRGIVVEAYSPLAHGTRFREPVLRSIGGKYDKSPAQVLIRWSLQMVSSLWRVKCCGSMWIKRRLIRYIRALFHCQNL
jgi:diketogulonate reductase-like aldo/keto reductase